MAITVSGLRRLEPSGLQSLSGTFHNAATYLDQADGEFTVQVTNPLIAGFAWSGEGQQEAATVARSNGAAMGVSTVQLEASGKAVFALYRAMAVAKVKVLTLDADAANVNASILDDGTVRDNETKPHKVEEAVLREAERIRNEAKGVLLYAASADAHAQELLHGVRFGFPYYTDTADATVLARNEYQLEYVNNVLSAADEAVRFWESERPQPLPSEAAALDVGDLLVALGEGALWATGGFWGRVASLVFGAILGSASEVDAKPKVPRGGGRAPGKNAADAVTEAPKRFLPADNRRATRQYGRSVSDVRGKAQNYAERQQRRGYQVTVPRVREDGRYGRPDVTVEVRQYDKGTGRWEIRHTRHFIVR